MPAAKCYCRPQRESRPSWPCEDASTALKLCCLSATVYDVRCWGVQGDRDRYVDYSPGDIIGQKLIGAGRSGSQLTINCDPEDIYPNTNLRGSVAFMFPDADVIPDGFDPQDAINPWLPCPCIQTELQDQGLIYTTLKTWVGVSWSYSCDTGLVSFRAVWGGWGNGNGFFAWQQYYQMVNQLAGVDGVATADPDWYLDNEITIPYATENDTNRLSRFSIKLRMTCEGEETCQPYLCYPKCVANTCDGESTINASAVFITANNGATDHEGTATWSDVSSEYTFSFDVGVLCGTLSGRIYCDGDDIKIDFDLFDGVTHTYATFTVGWTCVDGDVSWTTPTPVSGITCALDITLWTNNVS